MRLKENIECLDCLHNVKDQPMDAGVVATEEKTDLSQTLMYEETLYEEKFENAKIYPVEQRFYNLLQLELFERML